MKKSISRLKAAKGFTLVECVIAIAVFAIMTTMVMMIIGMAQKTQNKAMRSEEDLDALIANVVQDDTYKNYTGDVNSPLVMSIGGTNNFKVTYDVISGNKNWVKCTNPACGFLGDNKQFMNYVMGGTGAVVHYSDLSHFDPHGQDYICPECGKAVTQTLKCYDCENELSYRVTSPTGFGYDKKTCSYYCLKCGSTNVKGKDIDAEITAEGALNVSGIFANRIKYSDVPQPTAPEVLVNVSGPDGKRSVTGDSVRVVVESDGASEPEYTVTLMNLQDGTSSSITDPRTITMMVPQGYEVYDIVQPTQATVANPQGVVVFHGYVESGTKHSSSDAPGTITISNVKTATGTIVFKFKLRNFDSLQAFDSEYPDGLIKYWFRAGESGIGGTTSQLNNKYTNA